MRTVSFDTQEGSPLALSVAWIDGKDDDGLSFDLTSGAGVGSPYLRLTVTLSSGERVVEVIDIRQGVTDWVNAIVKEHET
jgi:hypothetical protein